MSSNIKFLFKFTHLSQKLFYSSFGQAKVQIRTMHYMQLLYLIPLIWNSTPFFYWNNFDDFGLPDL